MTPRAAINRIRAAARQCIRCGTWFYSILGGRVCPACKAG